MPYIPLFDLIAIVTFFAGWSGYSYYVDKHAIAKRPLAVVMNDYRLRWMERMLERDNRMADVNISTALVRSCQMFASTAILLIAGAIAMLGQIESVRDVIAGLAYARLSSTVLMEVQIFILTAIFIYAFFVFVWAIRLFHNMLVLLGAAPQPQDCDEAIKDAYPKHMAKFAGRAFLYMNRGVRAFTFGLALLGWLLHPLLLIIATVLVIGVLHRRDFRSISLEALEDLRAHH